ncbi:membrane protein [Brucella endophytica]|uniref:Membrane protein n=1 Tax=Brucella endophytica TaxID=1963359 RepID=A0A916WJZ2_9HYPH|nr:alpha-2-macroglobulin family protein [Brucella endophytica]GGB08549.1 membrane protein [Brucella endophytica]
MPVRVASRLALSIAAAFMIATGSLAAERQVITTKDSDYIGADLRTVQNVTLEQCEAACLGEKACRAFTYNTKAQWCFLKSDFSKLNPFPGAIAGKVVEAGAGAAPDIGAPPALTFLPAMVTDEARQDRQRIVALDTSGSPSPVLPDRTQPRVLPRPGEVHPAPLEPRLPGLPLGGPLDGYINSVSKAPDNVALWLALASEALTVQPPAGTPPVSYQRLATSAAYNAYQLSRTALSRARALAFLADGLQKREFYRPALEAYKASLALSPSPQVQASYDDLKARQGFRVLDNTIDSDSASPRACVQFSEPLAKAGVDYSQFVTLDNAAPKAVDAGDRQICIEGLQHGQRYAVTFRAGLPDAAGDKLEKPVTLNLYIRDRAPSVRFTGENFVLPSSMRRGIPLVSVNTPAADLKLYRVNDRSLAELMTGSQFLKQLSSYQIQNIEDQLGEPVWQGKLDIAEDRNKDVVTSIPIDTALPQRKPGVYVLTALPDGARDDGGARATQWFVVSNIGLATYAGEDGLTVFARSLASAKPLQGLALTLLARNNEVLGSGTTDADGRVTFAPGLTRGSAGLAPAVLTAKDGESDYVFLDLTRTGFDLSDRGVAGRPVPGPIDVVAWTERGIYRPGETVHATALARDHAAMAVENLPLTFIFARPDGVEDRRMVSPGAALGGHVVELPLPKNAMRGTWHMRIHTDPKAAPIADIAFLVQDFVPDRIEFDLSSAEPEIAIGKPARVSVDGRYLYGAPAAGLALEGEVRLKTSRERAGYPNYLFGLADDESEEASRIDLPDLPVLDAGGKASFDVNIDDAPSTTRPLIADVVVRMREMGGRAVERTLELPVVPQSPQIGIRPEFAGQQVPENSTAAFKVIAIDPTGKREGLAGAKWSLVRLETNYQWYRNGDQWKYEPVTYTKQVANGTLALDPEGDGAPISFPVTWGRYRLEVNTDDAAGPASSVEFDAGWYVAARSTETPDGLEIALDKESYAPGDVAKLQISPRFAGEALITIGADRLRMVKTVSVPQGGATVDIPVGNDWGAGAYVTATLFRPGDAQATRMPMRAIGIKWLKIDPGARKLAVNLGTPEKTQPRQPLAIPIEVPGLKAGDTAYVTVAAVDVGILNLTKYQAPDPDGWYFGQRQLGLEIRDLYGRLIDGSLGAMGKIRTGGDGGGMLAEGSPPTQKLVAFFSGPVKLDAQGKANVSFDMPEFNGTVRVMTTAWTKSGVGHAVKDVIVRDPVVVTASLPEFLAPGDKSQLRLDIANTDGPAGDYVLGVDAQGPVSVDMANAPKSVQLAQGGKASLTIPLAASAVGAGSLAVRLTNADGVHVGQTLNLPVRPATMPVATRREVTLKPNGGSLTINRELLASSLLEGASVGVSVSRYPGFNIPALLAALDRYPYGCAEQVTSRAMPLLYLNQLSAIAGMARTPDVKKRIDDAIASVLSYQSSTGSFGLWSPGSGDLWLDAYITDFLTRAREEGYTVPDEAMGQALDNLQNALAYDTNVKDQGSGIAYALYVLARNRRANVGDLRYYADTQLNNFRSPLARAQLAAALSLYGDAPLAQSTFSSAYQLALSTPSDPARADYGSALRDSAGMLALAAESRPVPNQVPQMINLVQSLRNQTTALSTQDDAWMLLAARALKGNDKTISMQVNGRKQTGNFAESLSGQDVLDAPQTIVNRGTKPVQAVVTTLAAPKDPLPAGGNGFSITRSFYTLDGKEADVMQAKQNERFVVVLKVTENNAWSSRVLVTDLLPAGFEIDNPSLVSSADLQNFEWLGQTDTAHSEFRTDRFVAAFDRTNYSPREFTVAYVVRGVRPGTYALPAASVEDMYRPELSARTAAGMMEVGGAPQP